MLGNRGTNERKKQVTGAPVNLLRRCHMLYHVTMAHTPDNCPVSLPPDELKEFFARSEKIQEAAEERNINIKFMVAGIGHTMYALIEADSFDAMNVFFGGMPFKQDIQIEPVGTVEDIMASFRAEMAK
jgi:muconolactone delta-isomerase